MEARAARGIFLQANRAAMVIHDFRDDGQPRPTPSFLEVKKGLKICSRISGGTPGPVSSMSRLISRLPVRGLLGRDRQSQHFLD